MDRSRYRETPASRPDDPAWQSIVALCLEAGDVIVNHYHEPSLAGKLREKDDDSPLTRADIASHELLIKGLADLAPGLPVLSEESDRAAIAGRREWEQFWMVDPLDGTREFLERSGEFTINIALIKGQRAVAGLIYEPLTRQASVGVIGAGAVRYRRDGDSWCVEPLATRRLNRNQVVVLSSRRHRNERLHKTLEFLSVGREVQRNNSGSALKFAALAAGEGDCYPRFSPCSEWDVAAGDALVTAAGGAVLGLDGNPVLYNSRDTLLAKPFLAVGDRDADVWPQLLEVLCEYPS